MPSRSDELEPEEAQRHDSRATREHLGFLLAKASQRWNALLYERFVRRFSGTSFLTPR
jgi:hypothetical protein